MADDPRTDRKVFYILLAAALIPLAVLALGFYWATK